MLPRFLCYEKKFDFVQTFSLDSGDVYEYNRNTSKYS